MRSTPQSAGEWIGYILWLILGVTIMASSLGIGFGRFTKPGPGLFPFLCGLILAVQSVVLYLVSRKNPALKDDVLRHPGSLSKFFRMLAVLAAWVSLMPFLGWLLLTFLATFAIAKIMDMDGWLKPLFLAAANTGCSYLLFGYLLAIDLPLGFGV